MKTYSTSELRRLQVINVCDGACLGYASDFEFEEDCSCARVTALIIAGSCGFFGIGGEEDLVIPWCHVKCIGEDTVLVELGNKELLSCHCKRRKQRSWLL